MASTLHDPRYRALVGLLVDARQAAGLTQAALSQKLGKPQSFLGKVETFQRRLDALELFDMLEALAVPPDHFGKQAVATMTASARRGRRKG